MRHILRSWLHNLMGLNDSPHKIALGLALGIFIGFLPIMGIQMVVVLPFAVLFRGNKTAAIGGVWISNPVTVIPIYYMNYWVGLQLTRYTSLHREDFIGLFRDLTMNKLLALGQEILVPLLVGSFAVAVAASIPTYLITRLVVVRRRRRALPVLTPATTEPSAPLPLTAEGERRSADPPEKDRRSPGA